MLVIVGMILLLTWIFEHAFHLTADSLMNLLLLFASISFALDFVREREVTEIRPGWDNRPRKLRMGNVSRWLRQRLNPSLGTARKPADDAKRPA